MAFVDKCIVELKAGNGGDGIVAWRREAHVPMGGPAGGNGGNGGNIILVGDHNENSLQNLKYLKTIKAENGEKGDIKTMQGKSGNDTYIKVPVGTVVIDEKTNEIIVDIVEDKQEFIICRGGEGGHGNYHFKSNMNKAPTLYELGDVGEYKKVIFTLKYIADIGLVGLPNAGKSTFLSKISAAKPKIADYEFTTLTPNLGTIYRENQKIIFADIPGLIEGASEGLGLGHDFLKHIERTKVLIHIISMDPINNESVIDAYETINNELKKYNIDLISKPTIVVCNKIDVEGAKENFIILKKYLNDKNIIAISAKHDDDLEHIVQLAFNELKQNNQKIIIEKKVKIIDKDYYKTKQQQLDRTLNIIMPEPHVFVVKCEFLDYWSHKIPLNTQDNIVRFNQKMQTINLEQNLKLAGAKKGDLIIIDKISFNFDE